jgi:uncharacterized lipoprotein YbaY
MRLAVRTTAVATNRTPLRSRRLASLAAALFGTTIVLASGCGYIRISDRDTGGGSGGGNSGGGGNTGGDNNSGGGNNTGGDANAGGGNADNATRQYAGVVTGNVTYLERIILPQEAAVRVRLLDTSRPGGPAVISEQQYRTLGKAPPYAFKLVYDPKTIVERNVYAVEAEILVQGRPRFASPVPTPVITAGAPAKIELIVRAARQ